MTRLNKNVVRWRPLFITVFVPIPLALLVTRLVSSFIPPTSGSSSLEVSNLLEYFGVAAGLVYAHWSYLQSKNEKDVAEQEEIERAMPVLQARQELVEGGHLLTIKSLGSQRLRCLTYGETIVAQSLPSGATLCCVLVSEPQRVGAELQRPVRVESFERETEDGRLVSFALNSYDSAGRMWLTEFDFDGEEVCTGVSLLVGQ